MHDLVPSARKRAIAVRLTDGHAVVAAELAAEFGVSEDAIRRDLRMLAAEGVCTRVYGGALPLAQPARATPLAQRLDQAQTRKDALARAAAATIRPGEFIFLDNGSTNLALVPHLPADPALTVATNSVDIAAAVARRGGLRLIVLGGAVDLAVGGCVDAAAVTALRRLNIDRGFVGACAVDPAAGLSAFDAGDAVLKGALVDASYETVAMVTNEKLGTRAPFRFASAGRLSLLVVEHDAPPEVCVALGQAGATLQVAAASVSP